VFPDGFVSARCGEINRFGCGPARFISVSRAVVVLADSPSASVTRITVPSAWRSAQNLKNSQVLEPSPRALASARERASYVLLAAARSPAARAELARTISRQSRAIRDIDRRLHRRRYSCRSGLDAVVKRALQRGYNR